MSYARARGHARARPTGLRTDCTVKRGDNSRGEVGQCPLGAVTLATVEIVGALVGPHAAVD